MTYPPQQPGPYGAQGPRGAGPYGPPPGGFPPQGQPPPGYGQPGYGQPGQFGQPAYGPPPGYGYQPYPGGMPPKKRNTALIVSIGVALALVVAAVLITGLVAPGWMVGSDRDDPNEVARAVATAYQEGDEAALVGLTCTRPSEEKLEELREEFRQNQKYSDLTATVGGTAKVDGDRASVPIKFRYTDAGEKEETDGELNLRKKEDQWCLDVGD